jgi:hypothetical protein
MVDLAETDPSIGLVFCRRHLLISQVPTIESITWCYRYADPVKHWAHRLATPVWGAELLKRRDLLCPPKNKIGEPPSVLLRRTVFERVGFFNPELRQSLDYEFWYRVLEHYKVGFISRKLNVFRVHENQATQRNREDRIFEDAAQALVNRIDPSLLHADVVAQASGFRSLFSRLSAGVFFGKGLLVKLLVLLKIMRGKRFF